ncbi:helix-turn-helix transcriptional regulator [Sphaerisporangium sp. NPDC088356]|uniref:helix-turn-helix domain-containing protein n=1 Tax=Sphaerisporangium sp. NPDC088356 TaxID=3154871 RepID=UPI00341CCE51
MSAERLSELLSELKLRGGRTYEALGRRTGMSRSTVHRYCRGEIVPDSYGPLERIARACGATKAEQEAVPAVDAGRRVFGHGVGTARPVPGSGASGGGDGDGGIGAGGAGRSRDARLPCARDLRHARGRGAGGPRPVDRGT